LSGKGQEKGTGTFIFVAFLDGGKKQRNNKRACPLFFSQTDTAIVGIVKPRSPDGYASDIRALAGRFFQVESPTDRRVNQIC